LRLSPLQAADAIKIYVSPGLVLKHDKKTAAATCSIIAVSALLTMLRLLRRCSWGDALQQQQARALVGARTKSGAASCHDELPRAAFND